MKNNLSVYVHIPFCVRKCNYCAFYSLPLCDERVMRDYTEALIRQINSIKTERPVTSVYFGGGTPPVLGVGALISVLEAIKAGFRLSDDCEITLEANPESVSLPDLKDYRNAGFNRISMGMQSSNDRELAILGRRYDLSRYKSAVRAVIDAGFENRSTDIIFGIPEQTIESLEKSVMTAVDSGTPHISAYSLSIEKNTPFYNNRDTLILPDEDTEEEMYYLLCDILKKHDYSHYEISSFAREGFQSRHNLHYWDCGEYIGFGTAAHSYCKGKRFSNIADVNEYISLSTGDYFSPTDFHVQRYLSDTDKREEAIMLGLRTDRGIRADDELLAKSKKYIDGGFAKIENGRLILTEKGYRVSNIIIAALI